MESVEPHGLAAVAIVARDLAQRGTEALPDAVGLLARSLSVEASVLVREVDRSGPGPVLWTAGAAIPHPRSADSPALLNVPMRADGQLVALMTVMGSAALTEDDLGVVTACADLMSLTLAAALPRLDAARHVIDEEDERAEIAAALHEGAVQSLIAARYAIDTGADVTAVRAVVQQALADVRRVISPLRPRAVSGDLLGCLQALVLDLNRGGLEVSLQVISPPAGSVTPASAIAAYRVVAAALHGVAGPAEVGVDCDSEVATVTVMGAADPLDSGALARWERRVAALDGQLVRHDDGVTLTLPLALPAMMTSGVGR